MNDHAPFRIVLVLVLATLIASIALAGGQGGQEAQKSEAPEKTYPELFVVNGRPLDERELTLLFAIARSQRVEPVPGRYWYDARSGLYGIEGQGTLGQIVPGLALGGPLRADASRGRTGVFINGRQLHESEVAFLGRCTQVIPGRYWLDAFGNGGYEGGPAFFNLVQLCAHLNRGGATSGRYGSVLSDGNTTGAIFREPGGGVSGVTCGPDGGCIYD